MKIVFMGTPQFSATILKALVEAGHEITAVYTQPDKPKGRSGALIASPVKEYALSLNLPVYQPDKIKKPEYIEELRKIPADVFVVAAFGQILSTEILDMPKYGSINVHGSLLPKYRGAAPIQRSIAEGEKETGVTIMQMDAGIDTGDMMKQVAFPITMEDTEDSVYEKMADFGSKALLEVLAEVEAGTATHIKQDEALSSYAKMLKKEEGLLDFNRSAVSLDCMVRGFQSWPTAYSFYKEKMLKVYAAKAVSEIANMPEGEFKPGSLIVTKKNIYVCTGEGYLELLEVQLEGKKRMSAMDCARGIHLQTGDSLNE